MVPADRGDREGQRYNANVVKEPSRGNPRTSAGRQSQVTARLQHPHIVHLHESATAGGGRDADTLAGVLRGPPVTLKTDCRSRMW